DLFAVRRHPAFNASHAPVAALPDGSPVRFPTPEPRPERYDLDAQHPGLFQQITRAIAALTMARYRPSFYLIGGAELVEEATLAGLLQSGVLKRFESCWWACLKTMDRMMRARDAF